MVEDKTTRLVFNDGLEPAAGLMGYKIRPTASNKFQKK